VGVAIPIYIEGGIEAATTPSVCQSAPLSPMLATPRLPPVAAAIVAPPLTT